MTMSRPPSTNPRSMPSRTFPIRTSQSQRRVNTSSSFPYAIPSHHHLRRKTPNGAIEAAYDGSFQSAVSHGAPPKQMILPPSEHPAHPSSPASSWQPNRQVKAQGPGPGPGPGQLTPADDYGYAIPQQLANGDFWQQSVGFQLPPGMLSHQPAMFNSPPAPFFNSYQPIIRANEHNMRAFCPPPVPFPETLPFGQGAWQPDNTSWNHSYTRNSAPTYQPLTFPDAAGYWPQRMAHYDYHVVNHQIPHMPFEPGLLPPNLESLSLEPMGAKPSDLGYPPQPRFKEKALQGAHEAYADLLTHADMMGKGMAGKFSSDDGNQLCPRLMAFPKPPNPFAFDAGTTSGSTMTGSTGAGYGSFRGTHCGVENSGGLANRTLGTECARPSLAAGDGCHPGDGGFAGTQRPAYAQVYHSVPPPYHNRWDEPTFAGKTHPVTTAKFRLELMNNLCEQDGWKWTSGMLIAGCLNYVLGNYTGAFENFSRVIAADAR